MTTQRRWHQLSQLKIQY